MLRNIHKNNGFSGRYFSETDEKTMCFFFWFLEDSWEAGGKDKSFSKTRKCFVRFLKSSDQKKNIVL